MSENETTVLSPSDEMPNELVPVGKLPIQPVSQMDPWGICLALYGAPGTGKTTLAGQLGYSKSNSPVLFLDAEGGVRSITHIPNVFSIQLTTWAQFNETTSVIMRQGKAFPYPTIVLDNMSEFQSLHMRSINSGVPEIRDWNINTQAMLAMTRQYRDFARKTGINVIFIAWSSLDKNEDGAAVKNRIGFTPSLAEKFPGIVDIVGFLSVEAQGIRQITFAPSTRTDAKFRRAKNENANKIPLTFKYAENVYPLVDIISTLKEGTIWPDSKYVKNAPVQAAQDKKE